ncbi:MAG TPA: glycosyltransferase [Anaeromyxobacteraceae bacterium]|nr:glycosyltransferase [Anaeromyxobacteraceae bacterium]
MPSSPTVSVIMPAYDAAEFMGEAVRSALRQTFADLEVVIVDDGSTDDTAALAERLGAEDSRVRLVRKENGGPSSARNAGIAAARGELVCFLDADDVFLPDKLERQLAFLRLFPACDLVYSDFYVGDDRLTPVALWSRSPPDLPMQELFAYCCWFAPFSPLLRAGLLARVGPFDEELRTSEDWDFWLRASRAGTFGYLPGPVGVYRTHPRQAHHDGERIRRSSTELIRKHFQPGSREWHGALAAMAWSYAKRARASGDYVRMSANLLKLAFHLRSLRTLKHVFRLAGY